MPLNPLVRLVRFKLELINEMATLKLNKTQMQRCRSLTKWFKDHNLTLVWHHSAYSISYQGKKIMNVKGQVNSHTYPTFKKILETEF